MLAEEAVAAATAAAATHVLSAAPAFGTMQTPAVAPREVEGPAASAGATGAPAASAAAAALAGIRETLLLPRAQVLRIVKAALPADTRVDRRAVQGLSRLAALFLLALADAAAACSGGGRKSSGSKRKMLTPQHVLAGLRSLGFEDIAGDIEKHAAAASEEGGEVNEASEEEQEGRDEAADKYDAVLEQQETPGLGEDQEEVDSKEIKSAVDAQMEEQSKGSDAEEEQEASAADGGAAADAASEAAAYGISCALGCGDTPAARGNAYGRQAAGREATAAAAEKKWVMRGQAREQQEGGVPEEAALEGEGEQRRNAKERKEVGEDENELQEGEDDFFEAAMAVVEQEMQRVPAE